jgi:phage major head subunit gpT-like protein
MSNILNDLGVDTEDFDWWHLAVCRGMDTNLFYDKYEMDVNIAKNIDDACMSCPVMKMCYQSGVDNSEYGVWGGVYMSSGEIDKSKNLHKTPEVWKKLRSKGVI